MKYIIIAFTFFTLIAQAQQPVLNKDIAAAKKAVVELNQELSQLEQELLSPKGTGVSFYFSLRGGQYFVPLAVEISGQGLTSVHHVYTEQEVEALRMGAIHPIGQSNLGAGKHKINIKIRGVNQQGESVTLNYEDEVEKSSEPLKLEVSVRDDKNARKANAQLAVW